MEGFNNIPRSLLQADNTQRQKWVIVPKKVPLHHIVYVPLESPVEARFRDESELPEVLRLPVAVYELNTLESYNRPVNFYFYKGDDYR